MKKKSIYNLLVALAIGGFVQPCLAKKKTTWPDGTVMSEWFSDTTKIDVNSLGRQYVLTDYGVSTDSTQIQTAAIQRVIDRCASDGGGVIVVPKGTFLTGALFFKPKTHLHFQDGGKLKGIDAIKHYPLVQMHFEGLPLKYFAALINAEHVDGFTITGHGTIDGNGLRFWEEFWIRRAWNRQCTNLEALRPQLIYIAHSNDVTVQDVRTVNSGFWTNHLYRVNRARYLDCHIESPTFGTTRAPSTDGIDLDDCDDVLVKGCYINVCDDGVCLKGGKGTYVDSDSTAGPVNRVLVENCVFGSRSNGGVTFGSEAWNCHNIVMRNCEFRGCHHVVLFKMREDTPQNYGDVRIENCHGNVLRAIEAGTWKQFKNKVVRNDMPTSQIRNVTINGLKVKAERFFVVRREHPFIMDGFYLTNIQADDDNNELDIEHVSNLKMKNVTLNGKRVDK
ncbi:MAG: glycoside hydrolase family 28 protein [Prevotella sp.]|jgi:polygalacturonase